MQDRIFGRLLGVTVALHVLFAMWPQIDIAVSQWFLRADGRFWLSGNAVTENLRHFFWFAALGCAGIATAMLCCTMVLGYRAKSPWRLWAFITTLFVTGPGILVNLLLKQHWGRARPVDVAEFGGTLQFTPPFEITNQCLRNCSFVSGEAAAAAVLCLVIWVILQDRAPRLQRNLIGLALGILFVCVAGQRVASGRHFLSDVIFAGLLMLLTARFLHLFFRLGGAGRISLLSAMRADMACALRAVVPLALSFGGYVKGRIAR